MRGLLWIDGILRDIDGEWKLKSYVEQDRKISPNHISLQHLPRQIIDTGFSRFSMLPMPVRVFSCHDLSKAERLLDPIELLGELLPELPISNNHMIYRIGDENPIYIPAILLIRALFMGKGALNKFLLTPGAVDLLGIAYGDDDPVRVAISNVVNGHHISGRTARTMAWLLTNHDARMAHASVLENARQGRIDLTTPRVSLTGWAWGPIIGGGTLALEIGYAEIVRPLSSGVEVLYSGPKTQIFAGDVRPCNNSCWWKDQLREEITRLECTINM